MNYRHGFHAGNFADVMKHALLARILTHLAAKPAAYRVIDLHGGSGLYDLASSEAERTGEWRDGIARIDAAPLSPEAEALLAPYRTVLAQLRARRGGNAYPGSPLIAQMLMRPQDRLIANELEPAALQNLRGALAGDRRCKVLALDAAIALRANVPPPEKRGLVLIDPPFERADEFAAIVKALAHAHAKWPTGIYAIWYPVKDQALADAFIAAVSDAGIPRLLRMEMSVHDRTEGLGGTGLLVVNPPWLLASEAAVLLPALAERLAMSPRASYRCDAIQPDG